MKAAQRSLVPVLALSMALAACVPATKAPPVAGPVPASRPAPARPAPAPAVPQAPDVAGWADKAATPGDWRYAARGPAREAGFWSPGGAPLLRLRCLADSGMVVLSLPESGAPRPLVTVRAETATRTLEARSADGEMTVALSPQDPLLDAMALSKGRFAVESEGLPPLYLPSYAEVSRVIEDCR